MHSSTNPPRAHDHCDLIANFTTPLRKRFDRCLGRRVHQTEVPCHRRVPIIDSGHSSSYSLEPNVTGGIVRLDSLLVNRASIGRPAVVFDVVALPTQRVLEVWPVDPNSGARFLNLLLVYTNVSRALRDNLSYILLQRDLLCGGSTDLSIEGVGCLWAAGCSRCADTALLCQLGRCPDQ